MLPDLTLGVKSGQVSGLLPTPSGQDRSGRPHSKPSLLSRVALNSPKPARVSELLGINLARQSGNLDRNNSTEAKPPIGQGIPDRSGKLPQQVSPQPP